MSRKPRESKTVRNDTSYYLTEAWFSVRTEVLDRDNHTCRYCGNPAVTADHVVPRSRRGSDTPDNLVASCNDCNKWFWGKPFENFDEKKAYHQQYYMNPKIDREIEDYKNAIKGKSPSVRRAVRENFAQQGKKTRRSTRKFQCALCARTSRTGTNWINESRCDRH